MEWKAWARDTWRTLGTALSHRGGFRAATRHIRFQLARLAPASDAAFHPVPVGLVPWEQLAEFDRTCFPSPRNAYLREWIAQPSSCSFASIEDGTLRGYWLEAWKARETRAFPRSCTVVHIKSTTTKGVAGAGLEPARP